MMDKLRGIERDEVERLLASLGEYELAIPDELVSYYLMRSGFKCDDIRVQRLVSLAAQKFLADIANDAIAHSKLRQQSVTTKAKVVKEPKMVLTSEDLDKALREYGVSLRKPAYYADHAAPATPEATGKTGDGKPSAPPKSVAADSAKKPPKPS
uniref:Transcription initiation factor TFIID subunit 10 n=1 Tax=Timspurckia oligopyrenoides TaxID=708627 RepID=A0A7S0ZD84_9RHOD|mmetsp:Transcript_133/g.227  ORF Transcript_133/g.227 Transcript_133/m.227 type:complete len:154 (+) Transcript_133:23-484(+)